MAGVNFAAAQSAAAGRLVQANLQEAELMQRAQIVAAAAAPSTGFPLPLLLIGGFLAFVFLRK
jgi:hypothetical protein